MAQARLARLLADGRMHARTGSNPNVDITTRPLRDLVLYI